jgi:hypothetical protein
MPKHRIFATEFAKVYPLYLQKAERKNRTKDEVDEIIRWLTGYSQAGLEKQIGRGSDFETSFLKLPPSIQILRLLKAWCVGFASRKLQIL